MHPSPLPSPRSLCAGWGVTILLTCLMCSIGGCALKPDRADAARDPATMGPPPLADDAVLRNYLGQVVTLRGRVANTRFATLRGVQVRSDDPDLRNHEALATGVLRRWEITRQSTNRGTRDGSVDGNRVQYGLFDPQNPTQFAQVRPVER